MEDRKQTTTTERTGEKDAAPGDSNYVAYHVRGRAGTKGYWTRIGSAWRHADGKGFNVQLEMVPLDGRVTLRVESDRRERE